MTGLKLKTWTALIIGSPRSMEMVLLGLTRLMSQINEPSDSINASLCFSSLFLLQLCFTMATRFFCPDLKLQLKLRMLN